MSPNTRLALRLLALAFAVTLAGCGGDEDAPAQTRPVEVAPTVQEDRADPTIDPTAIDPDLADGLRALGYADVGESLPEDAAVGVLAWEPQRSAPGLNLFTNSHYCRTDLMDMQGNVQHSWSHAPCYRWGNAVLTPEGDLLVVGRTPFESTPESASEARYLLRMGWDGTVKWEQQVPVHHDVELMPDGRIASLTYRHRLIPEIDASTPVRDHAVVIFSAAGELLEETSLWDILSAASFEFQPVQQRFFDGASELDYLHSNGIEFMRYPELVGTAPVYRENAVLLCMRHQDAVALIDWDTKELLWSWGQGQISGPHDATMLASGNVLIFDNGLGRGWSRVVEVDPRTDEIVWEYRDPVPTKLFTKTRGSNQRLSNGNTLITDSEGGRTIEVTSEGEKVWEFLNPNLTPRREPSVVVRMRRYEGVSFAELSELVSQGRVPTVD